MKILKPAAQGRKDPGFMYNIESLNQLFEFQGFHRKLQSAEIERDVIFQVRENQLKDRKAEVANNGFN